MAAVQDEITKIEEYDDTAEEKQIGKAKQIMGRRVKFNITDLEQIERLACLSELTDKEKETLKVTSDGHSDTLSRVIERSEAGSEFKELNASEILKTLNLEPESLQRRLSIKSIKLLADRTVNTSSIVEKIEENNDEQTNSAVKKVRM